MFTGIIRGIGKVTKVKPLLGRIQFDLFVDNGFFSNIEVGASVAVDGACLTVVDFTSDQATFDVIQETLDKTTLKSLKKGDLFNVERAAKFGDEIGGHMLSGHVFGTAAIESIDRKENNYVITFTCPLEWTKYLFSKGYIALNGASLTLGDIDKTLGRFSVHLIPETLKKTTFPLKKVGDLINIEIDTQTQIIVDTVIKLHSDAEKIEIQDA